MLSEPERVPPAVGANVTLILQKAAGARVVPQLFVCAKSPVTATPEMFSVALPVLVSLTAWAALVVPSDWLAKVKLAGDSATAGAARTPEPESATEWGLPGALSVTARVAAREPT